MKKWIAWILLICLIVSATGCNQIDGSGQMIYYEGNTVPKNVDPLLAESASELLVVQHLFIPLLSVNDANGVQPAAAQSYTTSDDQKSYTFTLRSDLYWSDGEKVTAADFAFNLKRALDPKTKAVCAGQLTTVSGVTADSDSLLTITLSAPNSDILTALSGVAGMPCRQDFFEGCGGRYGMGKSYIISNGAFYVSRWIDDDNDKYLRLLKHDEYYDAKSVLPAGITMTFQSENDRILRVKQQDVDCALLSSNQLEEAQNAQLNTLSYYSDSYGLLFNTQNQATTQNKNLRKALVGAVDTAQLATYLPGWCQQGTTVIIPDKYYGSKPYGSLESGLDSLQGTVAQNNFKKAFDALETDDLKNLTLYYVEADGVRPVLDYLVQCWQKEFGLYVSLTAVSQYELEHHIANQTFDIALCSMGNPGKNTLEVLEQFGSSADNMRSGFAGKKYDTLLKKAKKAGESDLTAQQQCEQLLQTSCVVMPLFYTRDYYVYSPDLSGLTIDSFTRVLDFTQTGKLR